MRLDERRVMELQCEECACAEACCVPAWPVEHKLAAIVRQNCAAVAAARFRGANVSANGAELARAVTTALFRNECFPEWSTDDWFALLDHLKHRLTIKLRRTSALHEVDGSRGAWLFGDLHGQYDTLRHWIRHVCGTPKQKSGPAYVFMGDYVDRGPASFETAVTLLCLSATHDTVSVLRGNHELPETNQHDLRRELKRKFKDDGDAIWAALNDVFACLPLMARIDGTFLCMHGGIHGELDLDLLSQIKTPLLSVFTSDESAHAPAGALCDTSVYNVLWSDPTSASRGGRLYLPNNRGPGIVQYSPDAVEEFFRRNNMPEDSHIFRAHQVVNGAQTPTGHSKVTTVFSATMCFTNSGARHSNAGGVVFVPADNSAVVCHKTPKNAQMEDEVLYSRCTLVPLIESCVHARAQSKNE